MTGEVSQFSLPLGLLLGLVGQFSGPHTLQLPLFAFPPQEGREKASCLSQGIHAPLKYPSQNSTNPSRVYFIPSNPNASTALNTITERLRSAFIDEDLVPVGRWVLESKLMRDTPGCLPASATTPSQRATKACYMQFLSLSQYPHHGFIYTTEPAEKPYHPPGTIPSLSQTPAEGATLPSARSASPPTTSFPMSTTPSQSHAPTRAPGTSDSPMLMTTVTPSAYGSLFQHFTYACQPFWCHRVTVIVPNGVVYEISDFRIRIGDVRQTYPTARVRGTVVEIEWRGPSIVESLPSPHSLHSSALQAEDGPAIDLFASAIEESDIDAEYAATASLIREFWARLRVDGAREAILVPGVGTEVKNRLRSLKEKGLTRWKNESVPGIAGLSEEDPDPQAGADVARQFLEVLRFNR